MVVVLVRSVVSSAIVAGLDGGSISGSCVDTSAWSAAAAAAAAAAGGVKEMRLLLVGLRGGGGGGGRVGRLLPSIGVLG